MTKKWLHHNVRKHLLWTLALAAWTSFWWTAWLPSGYGLSFWLRASWARLCPPLSHGSFQAIQKCSIYKFAFDITYLNGSLDIYMRFIDSCCIWFHLIDWKISKVQRLKKVIPFRAILCKTSQIPLTRSISQHWRLVMRYTFLQAKKQNTPPESACLCWS